MRWSLRYHGLARDAGQGDLRDLWGCGFFLIRLQNHRIVRNVRDATQITTNPILTNAATGRDNPIPLASAT